MRGSFSECLEAVEIEQRRAFGLRDAMQPSRCCRTLTAMMILGPRPTW
jgi:hypothetical protein